MHRKFLVPLAALALVAAGCSENMPNSPAGDSASLARGVGGVSIVANGTGLLTQPSSFTLDVPAASDADIVSACFYWSGRGFGPVGDDTIVINGTEYTGTLLDSFEVNSGRWTWFYKLDAMAMVVAGSNSFTVDGWDIGDGDLTDGIGLAVVYNDPDSDCTDIQMIEPTEFLYWADPAYPQGMVHNFAFEPMDMEREGTLLLFASDAKADRPDNIWWHSGAGAAHPGELIGGSFPVIMNELVGAQGPEFDVLRVDGIPIPADAGHFAYQLESPIEGNGDSILHSFAAFCVSTPEVECTGTIGDFVWDDLNMDGLQDSGEPGIAGVLVELWSGDAMIASTTTDADGMYLFTGLCAGDYTVMVDETTLPDGYVPSPCNVGTDDAIDNDCSPKDVVLPTDDAEDLTNDFGYYLPEVECTGTIGDFVWNDMDMDGLQGAGEPGLMGVVVELWSGGEMIASTTTDADGMYLFTGLCAGDYTVVVDETTVPEGWVPSPCNVGADDTIDNDCSPKDVVLPTDSSEDLTNDFGYYMPETPTGCFRTIGFWKHQFNVALGHQNGNQHISDADLTALLADVASAVDLYDGGDGVISFEEADEFLDLHGRQTMCARALQQFLATMLNWSFNGMDDSIMVDTDYDGMVDMTLGDAIDAILDGIASGDGCGDAKDMADSINNMHGCPGDDDGGKYDSTAR